MKKSLAVLFSLIAFAAALSLTQRSYTEYFEPEQMGPSELYARCYAKLIRQPIPINDATLASLKGGSIEAAEAACVSLLEKASLGVNGKIANTEDPEARQILETFQMLHNSWFVSQIPIINDSIAETKLFLDVDEPGLYWTRALLMSGKRVDSVLTYNKGLKSLRVRSGDGGITNFQARSFFNYGANVITSGVTNTDPLYRIGVMNDIRLNSRDGSSYSFLDVPDDQTSQFGEMIGITDQTPLIVNRVILPGTGDKDVDTILRNPASGPNLNVNLHAHAGGGIIGSTMYGLKNSNMLINQMADSYTLIDRRFASRVFQDLLCYQLPVLNAEDVDVVSGSDYPFQQSKSCMQCHATIDEFAMIQKNHVWANTSSSTGTFREDKAPPKGGEALSRFTLPVIEGTTVFALKPPKGELHFRTFAGDKVRVNVSSFAEVGSQLAKIDDFYMCAAKRYYNYFTGIDIPLGTEPANALEAIHYNNVKTLGEQLKKDQSLKNVVTSIFKTEVFQNRNFLTEGGGK